MPLLLLEVQCKEIGGSGSKGEESKYFRVSVAAGFSIILCGVGNIEVLLGGGEYLEIIIIIMIIIPRLRIEP